MSETKVTHILDDYFVKKVDEVSCLYEVWSYSLESKEFLCRVDTTKEAVLVVSQLVIAKSLRKLAYFFEEEEC